MNDIKTNEVKIDTQMPELVDINDIISYEKNQKLHPKEQIDKIKKSIQRFKFRGAILLNNRKEKIIICGHGRKLAMVQ